MTLDTQTTSQTADRLDILDLTARYNHAIDSGDGEGWAQTFTPDGVFKSARGEIVGRADLAKFATDWFAGSEDTRRHWVCNQIVEVDGDVATQARVPATRSLRQRADDSVDRALRGSPGSWRQWLALRPAPRHGGLSALAVLGPARSPPRTTAGLATSACTAVRGAARPAEEPRGGRAIVDPVVDRQAERRYLSQLDAVVTGHRLLADAPQPEDRGLRWIDDRRESVDLELSSDVTVKVASVTSAAFSSLSPVFRDSEMKSAATSWSGLEAASRITGTISPSSGVGGEADVDRLVADDLTVVEPGVEPRVFEQRQRRRADHERRQRHDRAVGAPLA